MRITLVEGRYKSENVVHIENAHCTLNQWQKIANQLKSHVEEIENQIHHYTDFKENEIVWVCNPTFINNQFTDEQIPCSIFKAEITNIENGIYFVQPLGYQEDMFEFKKEHIFKSKDEAIVSMIGHLDDLLYER